MKRSYTDHDGDMLTIEQAGETVIISIDDDHCVSLVPHRLALVINALLEAERRTKKATKKARKRR